MGVNGSHARSNPGHRHRDRFVTKPSRSKDNKTEKEKAILVGVATRTVTMKLAREHMAELGRLADTAGAVVVDTALQRRDTLDPATLIGQGLTLDGQGGNDTFLARPTPATETKIDGGSPSRRTRIRA